ncbi:type II toxin-antitoxin system VapC family toxin [Zhihengliuella salsuginis]|uniref:Ribonuclease VapC n=1 Tax=Zhihengliuella salsuginis TaxID=578222 RepID=A0ABQ3GIQ6_9MICC|nr:type II toxin-antitoxin system VapC family toxin [Zhihengliuella salsuginis]GHD05714.1 ribonuclease VapC [Zhihengliuella salsuginis]
MIILDTNVISELMLPEPSQTVIAWLDQQNSMSLYTTAVTAAELRAGVALLPDGKRRKVLDQYVEDVLGDYFDLRILPFDVNASPPYAEILACRRSAGRPIHTADAQIAAIARTHSAPMATRNSKDFDGLGLSLIDPWTPTPT